MQNVEKENKQSLLDKEDIQGLIVRGYGKLPAAKFILLEIKNLQHAKQFIADLLPEINTAKKSPDGFAINIAFTAEGFKAFQLPPSLIASFSREFLEGMSDDYRAGLLGDQNESDPKNWTWGGPKNNAVHLLLLLYAKDDATLDVAYGQLENSINFSNGLSVIAIKETFACIGNKEHFGFRDGIMQPNMEGLGEGTAKYKANEADKIKAGEFVLGYRNEYDRFTDIPVVSKNDDIKNVLPENADDTNNKDFGRNGTYLVYREIEQDVFAFWKYLETNSKEAGATKTEAAITLGAKMLGRWLGGTPLVLSEKSDDPIHSEATDFSYLKLDPTGEKCPFGAHIRRSNPRDCLSEHDETDSVEMIRKHQLLRRGRAFGKPIVESMHPEDILKLNGDDGKKRGLHFICLNGSLSRQFEFVQNIWIKSGKFGGLYNDGDPIAATRITSPGNNNDEFTCPAKPLRTKYKNIPQFVKIVGGAYFFLPGMKALKFITGM